MRRTIPILALFLGGIISGCEKDEGTGGRSSIRGSVTLEARVLLNNPATFVYEAPAVDWDVYIIYGDNTGPDDRVSTNYDGEFAFEFLREGDYRVYVISKDTTDAAVNGQAAQDMVVLQKATISDKKQDLELPAFRVYDEN